MNWKRLGNALCISDMTSGAMRSRATEQKKFIGSTFMLEAVLLFHRFNFTNGVNLDSAVQPYRYPGRGRIS